jgi:hypothetical protein
MGILSREKVYSNLASLLFYIIIVIVKIITGIENKIVESIISKPVSANSNYSPLLVSINKLSACMTIR